jgi:hypothetical protein
VSVVPATTLTALCTKAFGVGVQTVTEGLVVLSVHGGAVCAEPLDPSARTVTKKVAKSKFVRVRMVGPEIGEINLVKRSSSALRLPD